MDRFGGSLILDAKLLRHSFGSGRLRTWLLVQKRDYKNSGFEMYTQTPAQNIIKNKDRWWDSTTEKKPISPEYININEGKVVEIDTSEVFKSDPLKDIEVYYCKDAEPTKALIIGFLTRDGKKTYHLIREINAGNEKQKMSELPKIDETQILEKLYEENYTINKVLTIKIDGISDYHMVEVQNGGLLTGSEKYQKYIHKAKTGDTSHEKSVIDCNSKCNFTDFAAKEYNKDNLDEVTVYFNESDANNRVPLLIQFKPKSGQQFGSNGVGDSVYFKLESINKNSSENNPKEWTKTYQKDQSLIQDVINILDGIYSGMLGKDIQQLINYSEDNSTVIGAVSGIVTIALSGVITGLLIYKNVGGMRDRIRVVKRHCKSNVL